MKTNLAYSAVAAETHLVAPDQRAFIARLEELNRQVYKSTTIGWIAWPIIAYTMASTIGWQRVIVWLMVIALSEMETLIVTHRLSRNRGIQQDPQRWARWHVWLSICSGAAIGSSTWLMWPDDTKYQMLLISVLCAISAVGVASNGAMRRYTFGLLFPMWLFALSRLFSTGDRFHIVIALLALVFIVMMLQSAWEIGLTFIQSFRLRFENIDLVDQLSEEKAQADSANRAKTVFLASASHDMRQPVHALGLFLRALTAHIGAPVIDRREPASCSQRVAKLLPGSPSSPTRCWIFQS